MRTPPFIFTDRSIIRSRSVTGRGSNVDVVKGSNVLCRIHPESKTIKRADGSTVVTKANALFVHDAPIAEGDLIDHSGVSYVVEELKPIRTLTGIAHWEAILS